MNFVTSINNGCICSCSFYSKEEFEQLRNCTVSDSDYEKIVKVYTYFDGIFPDESSIVLFYHTFGMDGINRMLCEKAGFEKALGSLRREIKDEHQRYLDEHVRFRFLRDYTVVVLKTLKKLFEEHSHLIVTDTSSCIPAVISFLDAEIRNIVRGDYSV